MTDRLNGRPQIAAESAEASIMSQLLKDEERLELSLAPKLDHDLRCIMEQVTQPVEGQNDGQETAATHDGLQVPGCAGSA